MVNQGQEHDGHRHGHRHGERHDHDHGVIDPSILSTRRGIWAVKWSLIALSFTAVLQVAIVLFTGSVALFADTIHNFGDAAVGIPLWIAFRLARRRPSRRFTYGYGRVEDLVGLLIVVMIVASAAVAGVESVSRFYHPTEVKHLGALAAASIIGFAANEGVAIFRIRVGRQIGSGALVAEGYHARIDGWTSLAVLAGAIGIWLGFPLADPIVGLAITVAILVIAWRSARIVVTRILDGVDPETVEEIGRRSRAVEGVRQVSEVRARWVGHRLRAEVNISVDGSLPVTEGHAIAKTVRRILFDHLPHLGEALVHVDPEQESGEGHHRFNHAHDGLPTHSH